MIDPPFRTPKALPSHFTADLNFVPFCLRLRSSSTSAVRSASSLGPAQVGLESAAAQQYNDKRGLIESFDTAAERYLVKVPLHSQLHERTSLYCV